MRIVLLGMVLVVIAAGCGGSAARTHTLAKTRACLVQKGVRIGGPKNDFVATTASGGAIRAYLHGAKGNFVTLDFGADAQEAAELASGYERFHGKNIGVADILVTVDNVTMLWKLHPSTADSDLVTGCLK